MSFLSRKRIFTFSEHEVGIKWSFCVAHYALFLVLFTFFSWIETLLSYLIHFQKNIFSFVKRLWRKKILFSTKLIRECCMGVTYVSIFHYGIPLFTIFILFSIATSPRQNLLLAQGGYFQFRYGFSYCHANNLTRTTPNLDQMLLFSHHFLYIDISVKSYRSTYIWLYIIEIMKNEI